MPTVRPRLVRAAGAVVMRDGCVLLIHRGRYDDWSLPKGKRDRGEHAATTAVREVWEETGLPIRLGPRLATQRYELAKGQKKVSYWRGYLTGSGSLDDFEPNSEVDAVRWVPLSEAAELLTYPHDRATVAEAAGLPDEVQTLIVLRHGYARSRARWTKKPDRQRPLLARGLLQSRRIVPVLAAYGATHLVTSSSKRCVQTLLPYAQASGWSVRSTHRLAEEQAAPEGVAREVMAALGHAEPVVVCSHRPVLPTVWDVLGIPDTKLEPGGMLIVHHQGGKLVCSPFRHQTF